MAFGVVDVDVPLHANKVVSHVVRLPGSVTGKTGNVLEVGAVRVDSHDGFVRAASAQDAGPGVQRAQHRRARWWVKTGIQRAIGKLVSCFKVPGLASVVRVVAHEEVPRERSVFGRLGRVGRHRVIRTGGLIVTCFEEYRLVPCEGQSCSKCSPPAPEPMTMKS